MHLFSENLQKNLFKKSSSFIRRDTTGAGSVSGKVLAANYTGQVYLWADFTFSSSFEFLYDDYPNDAQQVTHFF